VEAHAAAFARHGTLSLVRRLDANVIRAGLRRVASAYSFIRFADVAVKLRLGGAEDAEFLCAKAVRDGVLDAELDNAAGTLVARSAANPYNSAEPQAAFHRRISFLLDVHHEAQRSMRYPAKAARADLETAEERRKREEEEQNLLEAIDKGEFDDGSGDDRVDLRDDSRFDNMPALHLDPAPGDLIIFGGGWRWHRVEPLTGTRARVTYGGFCAPSIDGDRLDFWA
jgi:hypothetical protein